MPLQMDVRFPVSSTAKGALGGLLPYPWYPLAGVAIVVPLEFRTCLKQKGNKRHTSPSCTRSRTALNRMFVAGTANARVILESDREAAEGVQLKELDSANRCDLFPGSPMVGGPRGDEETQGGLGARSEVQCMYAMW